MYSIGIDEVGRGPIAGPLVICACALRDDTHVLSLFPKSTLRDSKKLTEKARLSIVEQLDDFVAKKDVIFSLGEIPADEIDALGLAKAIQKATDIALSGVHKKGVPKNSFVFLDGSLHAKEEYKQETIIKGDEKIPSIALASIIAKVYRDTFMKEIAQKYPVYGFENHVGYGTKAHYDAIKKYGLTPLHRRSFLIKYLERDN